MVTYLVIGLMVLVFCLSYFARKLNRWVLPILYLAAVIYFIVAAIKGDVRYYVSLVFIIIGIYGAITSYRRSKAVSP